MAKEIRPLYRANDSTGVDEIFYPATTTDAIAHPTKRKSLTTVLDEIENGSVYDISAAHNNQPYVDLAAALGTNGANVPQSLHKGGIIVKFIQGTVQSSDNKYVQYRLMEQTFSTDEADWQGITDNAIIGSNDAISSNGVAKQARNYGILATSGSVFKVDDIVFTSQDAVEGDTISYDIVCTSTTLLALFNSNNEVLVSRGTGSGSFVVPSGFSYAKVVYSNGTVTVNKLEVTNITNRGLSDRIDDLVINDCIVVAAYDSSSDAKKNADIVVTDADSGGLLAINNAISQLPNTGGKIFLRAGTYKDNSNRLISIEKNNVTIEGECDSVLLLRGSAANPAMPLQVAANIYGTVLRNLTFDRYNNNGSKVRIENCKIGNILKDCPSTAYEYLIAASDAKDDIKRISDFICDGTSDESEINYAISSLSSGGCIRLSSGTFNLGSYININKSNITIIGSGSSTKLYRATTGGKPIFVKNSADNITICNLYITPIDRIVVDVSDAGKVYLYNVWGNNKHIDFLAYHDNNADPVVFVAPQEGIDGINNAIFNLLKNDAKGKIRLGIGTYTGTNIALSQYIPGGIGQKYGNGITIEGCGYGTIIDRDGDGVNDIVVQSGCANILLKELRAASNIYIAEPGSTVIDNCWIADKPVNDKDKQNNVINVGENYYFKTLSDAYNSIMNKADDEHYAIHIYGHTYEPITMPFFSLPNVDFIGHNNAVVEYYSYTISHFVFRPTATGILIKDIHFKKVGIGNYWNNSAVNVETEDAVFENVVFENATGSPTPFNQADYPWGAESNVGGRRHGITIGEGIVGKFENLIFRHCTAIGSPYGFQNTRGWYIEAGSPKLYDCIGYGGGIGENCHGIICHRTSTPILSNCIGYAGKTAYRNNAGIRLQASSDPTLIGCIGYGGVGYRYRSNGVPYETLHAKCQELGITDESFFYDGENVDYSAFTNVQALSDAQKLIMALDTDDIELVSLDEITNENKGISAPAGNCKGKFIDCIGYAGCGTGSIGLEVVDMCCPIVKGGYYGMREFSDVVDFTKDSGQQYMTFVPDSVKDNPYTILGIAVIGGSYAPVSGDRLVIETVEATPRTILDADFSNVNIYTPEINQLNIGTNVSLKVYVTNSGNIKNINGSFILKTFTCFNNTGCYALKIGDNGEPKIDGATFKINNASSAVYVASPKKYMIDKCHIVAGDTTSIVQGDANPVRMFNCEVDGEVDNSVVFANVQSINNSTNYTPQTT